MDSLPQELIDALVDILSNDCCSLCGLLSISRSLQSQARVHFFCIVHLLKEGSVLTFLDLCAPEIPHLVEDLLVALPYTVEHREGLEQLLERYPYWKEYSPWSTLAYSDVVGDAFGLTLLCSWYRNYQIGMGLEEAKVNQGAILSIEDLSALISILPLCSSIQLCAAHVLYQTCIDASNCLKMLVGQLYIYQPIHAHQTPPSGPKLEMLHVPFLTLEACRDDNNTVTGMKWFADCLKSGQGPVNVSRINILLTPSGKLDGSFLKRSVDEHIWTSLDSTMTAPRFTATMLCIWVGYVVE
ncbi:hypothetical protein EV421DRAFT_1979719 [Armillaria borealis]|uniref:Uncharacterized protein n=1 Tax=Armillaria borealis TaxID=47425 RepID=A0AA39MK20_9AGAR|nr:hypothetical protein EV421DRAFT_1979719 [Armillaria borealis]